MLVYTPHISPRFEYIVSFVCSVLQPDSHAITNDENELRSFSGIRINYSKERITEEEIWIVPHGLLTEKGIRPQAIDIFGINDSKAFFKTAGDFPFDIFSAAFYLLSRYEEYLPHQKDMYGRYAHENSLAFQNGFLDQPLVNRWAGLLAEHIKSKFPSADLPGPSFRFLPTYDIDEAFSYKHKGWLRSIGGIARQLIKGQWKAAIERMRVLSGKQNDPYDSFAWMDELHKKYALQPRYFFLVPSKNGRYDKNILPSCKAMRQLIQQHAGKYDTGLHPSWQSGDDSSLIKKEKETLESITGKPVAASRQHYIRLTLPETFRQLIDAGIKEEYSMGYGSINGFRASVASPFYWYDLEKDEATYLLLFPFCYMEANSFFEQKQNAAESFDELIHYYNEVKKVNGLLVTLWHNTFLGAAMQYEGWKEIYERFIGGMGNKNGEADYMPSGSGCSTGGNAL